MQNTSRFAIGIFLMISLVACNSLQDEKPLVDIPPTAEAKSPESPTVMAEQNWVIISKVHIEEIGAASWLVESDDFWTPSADDILKLEEKIAKYLSQNSSQFYRQPPVWERLDEYQRQYIGVEREGRKIIYGNYFCNNGGSNWQEKLVIVLDGGECFFQIEYDVESELFIDLIVNGEA